MKERKRNFLEDNYMECLPSVDNLVHKPTQVHRILILIAKVAAGIGILFWLWHSDYLNINQILNLTWDLRTVGLMTAAAGLVVIAIMILAVRQRLLLAQLEVYVSNQRVIAFTLIGALFGVILPGIIGGDVIKAIYLCGSAPQQRSKTVSAVFVDRIIGLYSLLLLGAIAGVVAKLSKIYTAPMQIMNAVLAIAIMATAVLSVLLLSVRTNLFVRLTEKLPHRLVSIFRAFRDVCDRPKIILAAIGISLISHGMVVLSFYAMAVLLRDSLALSTHFIVTPLAMVMNVVPLTPGGIGITEGAFAYLYSWCGSPQGAVVGLLGRFIQYFVFIVGGVIALLSTRIPVKELVFSKREF
jgi:uncharacterized protein (TIRG00374 family)